MDHRKFMNGSIVMKVWKRKVKRYIEDLQGKVGKTQGAIKVKKERKGVVRKDLIVGIRIVRFGD